MSIFSSILDKIMPSAKAKEVEATAENVKEQVKNESAQAVQKVKDELSSATNAVKNFDVVSKLNQLAEKSDQKLHWKTSIVDLLKLLGLDSSFDARKKLAEELGYTGNTEDSAAMNTWLHKTVMQKIAEKGGNVKDLLK